MNLRALPSVAVRLSETNHRRSLPNPPLAWLFELAGGAIGDFEDSCVPKEQREANFTVAALHQWDLGIDDPKCVTTAEDVGHGSTCPLGSVFDLGCTQWLDQTLKSVAQGGPFPSVCAPVVLLIPDDSRSHYLAVPRSQRKFRKN